MPQGYLHAEMDVKILILYILARIETPIDIDTIYEISYRDDSLNYFTLSQCLGELEDSGHISADGAGRYTITEKGRRQGAVVEDSLAIPVVQKVAPAITAKLIELHRAGMISTEVKQDSQGNWFATLNFRDGDRPVMQVTLLAPNEEAGKAMGENLRKNLSDIYKSCMEAAIDAGRKPITRSPDEP